MKKNRMKYCDFSFFICAFAMNKLRLSLYLCTASGSRIPHQYAGYAQFVHSKHFFLFPKKWAVINLQPLFNQ